MLELARIIFHSAFIIYYIMDGTAHQYVNAFHKIKTFECKFTLYSHVMQLNSIQLILSAVNYSQSSKKKLLGIGSVFARYPGRLMW